MKVFPAKYITKNVIFKRLSSKLCDISRQEPFGLKKNPANFSKSLSFILMKKKTLFNKLEDKKNQKPRSNVGTSQRSYTKLIRNNTSNQTMFL